MTTDKPDTIEEAPLNTIPKYYDNIVDFPLQDILKHRSTGTSVYRFEKYVDTEITIPAGFPGSTTFSVKHELKVIPFVTGFIKYGGGYLRLPVGSPDVLPGVYFDSPEVDETYIYIKAKQFSAGDFPVPIRLILFSVKIT